MGEDRAHCSDEFLCGNMARLNLLLAIMLAFISFPSIYGVKEEKAERKREVC